MRPNLRCRRARTAPLVACTVVTVPDPIFAEPRLAAIYDALDPNRTDLENYLAMVEEFGAESVLDVGCGTGNLAIMLANRGCKVVAVDPAAASLAIARQKPGAEQVTWLRVDSTRLPPLDVDLAVMTGNVAQVFVTDEEWSATLTGIRTALRPGGRLVFESRDPLRRAWRDWTREVSERSTSIPGDGTVVSWVELIDVQPELVSFRWNYEFQSDGTVMTSDSTLRFRSHAALADSLRQSGFQVDEVRDAPDRPGLEFIFIAHCAE